MLELLQTRAWALESSFFARMSPIILRKISSGGSITDLITTKSQELPKVEAGQIYRVGKHLQFSREDGYHFQGEDEDHIISHTDISGVITKNGNLCAYGTSELREMLSLKDEKKNVSAHLMNFDTPGGDVDGTKQFGNVIKNLKKPTIAFVDSMAASAGYWLASQCNWIVLNSENYTSVGSIGTLCMLMSQTEWLKKEGYKVEIIRSDKSKDKARLNSVEDWPEASIEELKAHINEINEDFIATVKAGRMGKLSTHGEDIFTGKMYDAQKALSMGMVDQVGTFEQALSAARAMAQNRKSLLLN